MLKFSCIFKLFYSHFAVLAVIKAPLTNPACTFIHKKPVEYTEFIHMPLRSSPRQRSENTVSGIGNDLP